jgi:hypothetical protein
LATIFEIDVECVFWHWNRIEDIHGLRTSVHFWDAYGIITWHIYFRNIENYHLPYFLFRNENKRLPEHFFPSFTRPLFTTFICIHTLKFFRKGTTYSDAKQAQGGYELLSETGISFDTVCISEMNWRTELVNVSFSSKKCLLFDFNTKKHILRLFQISWPKYWAQMTFSSHFSLTSKS